MTKYCKGSNRKFHTVVWKNHNRCTKVISIVTSMRAPILFCYVLLLILTKLQECLQLPFLKQTDISPAD